VRLLLVALLAALLAGCGSRGTRTETVPPVRLVTVPLVTQTSVIEAYERLHRAGLLVAIRNGFTAASLYAPGAARQVPRSGRRVPAGSVVSIGTSFGPIGSPAVSGASAVVPDFAGRTVTAAVTWAGQAGLFWEVRNVPPLPPSGRAHLFDNYVVVRQQPAAGARLRQGVRVGRGFRPTPLVVYARLRR